MAKKTLDKQLKETWLYKELYKSETLIPFSINLVGLIGAAMNVLDQLIFRGNSIYIKSSCSRS